MQGSGHRIAELIRRRESGSVVSCRPLPDFADEGFLLLLSANVGLNEREYQASFARFSIFLVSRRQPGRLWIAVTPTQKQ